jgi:D-alanyl-D-alanine-carboxypeptidase/D-alanyl-D-alanine-endopeptidase
MQMINRYSVSLAVAMITTSPVRAQQGGPSEAEVRKILADRIDVQRQSVGIVVGIVDATGRRIIAYGSPGARDPRPLDGDTLFEIGSMTKVFTSLLLADAVERKEVTLTDPVSSYLPATVKVPQRGRAITLQDLANHTSGLPRMPSNFAPRDAANPYADYSVEQMYQFLSGYQLARDVGVQYEYSNFGGGLLGHVLARRAGMDYEALVKARITGPLAMPDTVVTLTPALKARLAEGHSPTLQPAANWDLPTLAGAGALRSSANDMLTFLSAAIGRTRSPLSAALSRMLVTRWPTGQGAMEIAFGWHILKTAGSDIIWHNGGTGGYRSFMGYRPDTGMGVVVLSNTSTIAGVDDIGFHLLDSATPLIRNLPQVPASRVEVSIDPEVFDRYVGRYQLAPAAIITVSRNASRFFVQLTGQPAVAVFAESDKKYFLKIVDAQLTFEVDGQNKPLAVVLHQNGVDQRAPRIEGEPVQPPAITLAPEVLDRYTGRYQLTPALIFTITRQDARLFAQLTGQPAFEVLASGEREFFFTVVNAQLSFEMGSAGRAIALVLHQNGQTPRAPRID